MRPFLVAGWLAVITPQAAANTDFMLADLADLSLEELANIQVTSVAKRPTNIADAAASLYVITADEIRRMGVTTIPEALRLAPNLQVARRSSVEYAISARGFNNAVGNKLLVLIDGRTVYTPVYSGVFWEMQDTMMADIDRIEVISGPGATLWGANAVNGVINIITKPVADTQGALVSADAGTDERGGAFRFGFDSTRVYAMGREFDHTLRADGSSLEDHFHRVQAGFRSDWTRGDNRHTLQGDAYHGLSEDRGVVAGIVIPRHRVSGNNLLWRWNHQAASDSDFQVQVYWDRIEREEFVIFQPEVETLDFDFQHDYSVDSHHWVWGAGYRHTHDDVQPGFFSSFRPASRSLDWAHVFAQDEIAVGDAMTLTLGLKLEKNPFTGVETLPNARLAWRMLPDHLLWSSLSRAVRAPARFDRDVFFPENPPFIVAGGPDFRSEVANVFELGARGQFGATFTYSVTAFVHDWHHLRSATPPPPPVMLVNNIEGTSSGVEGWAHWQVAPDWRLSAGVSSLGKSLRFRAGTAPDSAGVDNATLHNDPDYQWMLRSRYDFNDDLSLDLNLYAVDELRVEPVPGYVELDARLSWRPSDSVEVALVGRNLLKESHPEFGAANNRPEFERTALLTLRWAP